MAIATTAEVVAVDGVARRGTFEPLERRECGPGSPCAGPVAPVDEVAKSVEATRLAERGGAVEVVERAVGSRDGCGVGQPGQRALGGTDVGHGSGGCGFRQEGSVDYSMASV